MKCADTEHDYFKFDDATVVCRKCADQRVVDVAALMKQLPQPIVLPCPGLHYPPPYQPTWWWEPWPNTTVGDGTTWTPSSDTTITYGGTS